MAHGLLPCGRSVRHSHEGASQSHGRADRRTAIGRSPDGGSNMRRVPAVIAATALLVGVVAGGVSARAPSAPAYQVADVGAYGGEPSIVSDTKGVLYDTTPSGGTITYRSIDRGQSWQQVTTADPNSGDDCLATDQSNAVYLCNLAGSEGVAPLQADVWKSVNGGATWSHGAGDLPQCGTSCSPFGVDGGRTRRLDGALGKPRAARSRNRVFAVH